MLAEAGMDQPDVGKLSVHLQAREHVAAGCLVATAVWGPHPTVIGVLEVPGFA